ncbi:MAG: mismatch-specific DNA-glycosylase [Nitrospiraceae bacterium]|nr:mismatch-specific DNA-glycosylase [Nitrospiraceae bacterium]
MTPEPLHYPVIPAFPLLPDYLASHLRVVFIGINPGLRSAAVGHHYAGPSNRFWKLLHEARLVSKPLTYREDAQVLHWGIGLTNMAGRPTGGSNELLPTDYERGRIELVEKITRFQPQAVALLGITLYPKLFPDRGKPPRPSLGLQRELLGHSHVFLLPNPSGRNAGYSYGSMLEGFQQLARWLAENPPQQ